jgi:hypothetical protein
MRVQPLVVQAAANHVIKDGVVIIEHKRGDLLMMECSDFHTDIKKTNL